jgi:ketosteroid isomerase-like protein
MRDTGRTAASLMAEISLLACRLPFGTILILQAATSQLAAQHLHSPCLPRSPPRTGAAYLVLPPPGDLVRTIAPDQTGPNAACASSSQLLPSRCCDDHLSPAWVHDQNVTVIHPSSKAVIVGWEAVRKSYAEQPARHKEFAVLMENPHITIVKGTALVVGMEKINTILANGQVADLSAMATSVYEKRDGKWLLIHHHGSRTPQ